MPVELTAVIVTYNSENFIKKCIASVLEKLPSSGEVIVVDNASEDRTSGVLSELKVKSEKLKIMNNKTNLGFAKANNLAVKEAKGEYLFFLNPDTELEKPIFEELIKFYEQTPDCGIVAPRLVMENGQIQPSVRKLPTILGAFKEYILGIKNEYSEYVPEGENPQKVEMVYGAAMLIRSDLFEKLGKFDEKYFLYYEDLDLCKRVKEIGKKIYYYPGASIKHLVGRSKSSKVAYKLNYESSIKYHGLLKFLMLRSIFLIQRFFNKF